MNDINQRYKYLEPLGFGSNGAVFCVRRVSDNAILAMKISESLEAEISIANITKRVKHYSNSIVDILETGTIVSPNIGITTLDNAIIDFCDASTIQYYIMDYMPQPFRDIAYLKRKDLTRLSCIFELSVACITLDKVAVLHNDLHLDNIMCKKCRTPRVYNINGQTYVIDSKWLPVIIDFGSAEIYVAGIQSNNYKSLRDIVSQDSKSETFDSNALQYFEQFKSDTLPPQPYINHAPIQLIS